VPHRGPGPHPDPPPDLATRALPLKEIAGPLFRIHSARKAPLYFGATGDNRFDDPRSAFGVLYADLSPACAFIETFGEPFNISFITQSELDAHKISRVVLSSHLLFVNLTGSHLNPLGADSRLFAGDHRIAQRWSRAFYEHPDQPCGLLYLARHDPSQQAVALFDRAKPSLSTASRTTHPFGSDSVCSGATLGSPQNRTLLTMLLRKYKRTLL